MFYVNASASFSTTFSYGIFLAIPEAWGWFCVSEENLGSEPEGKCPAPPGIEQREDFRPNQSMPDRAHLSRVHNCSEWEKKGKDPKVWEAGAPYRALGGQALYRPASMFSRESHTQNLVPSELLCVVWGSRHLSDCFNVNSVRETWLFLTHSIWLMPSMQSSGGVLLVFSCLKLFSVNRSPFCWVLIVKLTSSVTLWQCFQSVRKLWFAPKARMTR